MSLDLDDICRICLKAVMILKPIFPEENNEDPDEWDDYADINNSVAKIEISEQIFMITGLKVALSDELPKFMCSECLKKLEQCMDFRNQAIESHNILLNKIEKNIAGEVSIGLDYQVPDIAVDQLLSDFPDHLFIRDLEQPVQNQRQQFPITDECIKKTIVPKKTKKCKIGGKHYKSSLKNHMRSHHHVHKRDIPSQLHQNFACHKSDECDKTFDTVKDLAAHIKQEHSKIPDHRCDKCLKSFYTIYALELHCSRLHLDKHLLQCDQCTKTFVSTNKLKIHQRRHLKMDDEGVVNNECQLCGIKFSSSLQLHNHLEEIHVTISLKDSN